MKIFIVFSVLKRRNSYRRVKDADRGIRRKEERELGSAESSTAES